MTQHKLGIKPEMTPVDPGLIARQPTHTSAIVLCYQLSGLEDKKFYGKNAIVKEQAQWSRIRSGQHNFPQEQYNNFMDLCGNEAPLLWLAQSRGYALVPLETEMERRLREANDRNADLEKENQLLQRLVTGRVGQVS